MNLVNFKNPYTNKQTELITLYSDLYSDRFISKLVGVIAAVAVSIFAAIGTAFVSVFIYSTISVGAMLGIAGIGGIGAGIGAYVLFKKGALWLLKTPNKNHGRSHNHHNINPITPPKTNPTQNVDNFKKKLNHLRIIPKS